MSSGSTPTEVSLDLAAARRWALAARVGLAEARDQIDALNVFPVPDGDTGTNLFLTFDGTLEVLKGHHYATGGAEISLVEGLRLLARGMLLSARGNSGVILSQLARGLYEAAEAAGVVDEVSAEALAEAFTRADHLAWAGVSSPVEGTILSVSRAAASAARQAAAGASASGASTTGTGTTGTGATGTGTTGTGTTGTGTTGTGTTGEGASGAGTGVSRAPVSTAQVSAAALAAARAALEHTPTQLPALRRAGVVDAGGAGLVIVLEALQRVLTGDHVDTDSSESPWLREGAVLPPMDCADDDDGEGAYEVMYLLSDSDDRRVGHLRAHLQQVGHSVLVVGGPDEWRVHVHLDDPQVALEAGAMAGHVDRVRIEELVRTGATATSSEKQVRVGVGVVVCAPGEGWREVFEQTGATVVHSVAGARASTGQLLNAIWAVSAHGVVVLPNDGDVLMAANAAAAAAQEEGLTVHVVPSRAAVQGLAALAVFDPDDTFDDSVAAMNEAAGATVFAALTVASRDAQTPAGPCRVGQALGLLDGQIVVVDDDPGTAATRLLARLVTDRTELLTAVSGAQVGEDELATMRDSVAAIEAAHPDIEVVWLEGGQPSYPWLLGAE